MPYLLAIGRKVIVSVSLVLFFTSAPKLAATVLFSYAELVSESTPGVVHIRTERPMRRESSLDLSNFFFEGQNPPAVSSGALGSGFVLDREGYILTNFHIIRELTKLEVFFAKSRQKLQAEVIGIDPKMDIALLKVKAGKQQLYPLDLGDSSLVRLGDPVLAIGNPFGYSHVVYSGIVSTKGPLAGTHVHDQYWRTDALIDPTNSGGPLIDGRGRVIGLNTALPGKNGTNYALPINIVKDVLADLKHFGKVQRAWLGLVAKNILSPEELAYTGDPSAVSGVIVTNLIVDGPAFKAGLELGDLLMAVGEEKIIDLNVLQGLLLKEKPAHSVRLKVYRQNKGYLQIPMTFGQVPKNQDLPTDEDVI